MKKNILLVGYRDKSHSSAGGYDKIIDNPNVESLLGENVPFGFIPVSKRGKILNVLSLEFIARFLRWRYSVVHFFYGDTMFIPFLRLRRHKIVATIHMDVEGNRRFKKMFLYVLRRLDGVVVLSSNQQKVLKSKYQIDSIFIPHGFNKPNFKETNMGIDEQKINVVVLGQNYRDYDAISAAVEFCLSNKKNVHFHLIGQSEAFKKIIRNKKNVTCYPRLNDDQYFSVIKSCDYNFLPVTFATANNALLEAQFLGLRSILPMIPGILDYAAPNPLNIFYESLDGLKQVLEKLEKTQHSQDIIAFASQFEWRNVYRLLNEYYSNVILK